MSAKTTDRVPAGLPDLAAAQAAFARLCTTIAALRDPTHGCPWDLEQDHVSLRRYMIEEAYEAAEAMAHNVPREVCDELGDVLLQVVLNAQVAKDKGEFTIVDVVNAIDAKMVRRHPHVFGPDATGQGGSGGASRAQITATWQAIKADEKAKTEAAAPKQKGVFDEAAKKHPATTQALAIGKLAAKIRFDWDSPSEVFAQLKSEVEELRQEMERPTLDKARLAAEIGDTFFSLAQLCRHVDLDPETCAVDGNRKFLRRFAALEIVAAERGIEVRAAPRTTLEELWIEVKRREQGAT